MLLHEQQGLSLVEVWLTFVTLLLQDIARQGLMLPLIMPVVEPMLKGSLVLLRTNELGDTVLGLKKVLACTTRWVSHLLTE